MAELARIRCTTEARDLARTRADSQGVSLAAWISDVILAAAGRDEDVEVLSKALDRACIAQARAEARAAVGGAS